MKEDIHKKGERWVIALKNCKRCGLHKTRTQIVVGRGSKRPKVMFIGEAPGEEEDREGKPFVGRAGKILNKAIATLGLREQDYFITNIVKCRPVTFDEKNRPPTDEEKDLCSFWLFRQIEQKKPKILVLLGNHATQYILKTEVGITRLAGIPKKKDGIYVFPLLHPASILHQAKYRERWDKDLQSLKNFLESKICIKSNQYTLDAW